MSFSKECEELQEVIQDSYISGVTVDVAEKLAARFLHAQMLVANELRITDLDSRMRKSGTKAVRAKVYLDAVSGSEKKPTENTLTSLIDTNGLVSEEQNGLDKAEAYRDQLKNYFDISQLLTSIIAGSQRGLLVARITFGKYTWVGAEAIWFSSKERRGSIVDGDTRYIEDELFYCRGVCTPKYSGLSTVYWSIVDRERRYSDEARYEFKKRIIL